VRASFVPPQPIHELRDLTRTRKQLSREIVQHTQRIQKTLEDANVKLSSVLTDTLGKTGMRILDAIIAGETDARRLAALADYRVKASREELAEALEGRVTDHHRFLLKLQRNSANYAEPRRSGTKLPSPEDRPDIDRPRRISRTELGRSPFRWTVSRRFQRGAEADRNCKGHLDRGTGRSRGPGGR
jgi:transposase